METKIIARSELTEVMNNIPKSAIFTVNFIKKDGTIRDMNCRFGVTKHLTPNPKREKPTMPSNYKTVYDMKNNGYRHINIDTINFVTTNHIKYVVRGEI